MKYCPYCGKKLKPDADVCLSCGKVLFETTTRLENNTGLYKLIGFLLPIVGLVLYVSWKEERPEDASAAGKGALISVCVFLGLVLIFLLLAFLLSFSFVI